MSKKYINKKLNKLIKELEKKTVFDIVFNLAKHNTSNAKEESNSINYDYILKARKSIYNDNQKYNKIVESLYENIDDLNPENKLLIKKLYDNIQISKLDSDNIQLWQKISIVSMKHRAIKEKGGVFNDIQDDFKELVNLTIIRAKKLKKYYNTKTNYEAILKLKEEDIPFDIVEKIFENIKETSKKMIRKYYESSADYSDIKFPLEQQMEIAEEIGELVGLNTKTATISFNKSAYVFPIHPKDIKINIRGYDNNLKSIYVALHEFGHAIYEQKLSNEKIHVFLGKHSTMSIHETVSKLFEIFIGKNKIFQEVICKILRSKFGENIDYNDYLNKFNYGKTELTPIRVNSDELSYHVHIMIRYEIEKMLINEEIEVSDIPVLWNKMYKEHLNIDITDDLNGCLQDIHWYNGSFGYFPAYTIGSAIAAQLWSEMNEKNIINDDKLQKCDFTDMLEFLNEKIFSKGDLYSPKTILDGLLDKDLDSSYLLDYLKYAYCQ